MSRHRPVPRPTASSPETSLLLTPIEAVAAGKSEPVIRRSARIGPVRAPPVMVHRLQWFPHLSLRARVAPSTMDVGRILLRGAIGATFVVHGTQKLFGWFGGYGPDGTGQFFESLGLRPGRKHAMAAGAAEAGGGALLAPRLATPAGAAALTGGVKTPGPTVPPPPRPRGPRKR